MRNKPLDHIVNINKKVNAQIVPPVIKKGENMFKKIKLINKILKIVDDVEKIIEKNKGKFEELKKILEKAGELSPEIKKLVDDFLGLFKV